MVVRVWITALLILASALAGCNDKAPDESSDDGLDDLELEYVEDKGIIRGVVVDVAIRPVAGAKITLTLPGGQGTSEKVTDAKGAFGFDKLDPGSYFLKAEKVGFYAAQASTEVVAGLAEPPAVKMLLEADPAGLPFIESIKFDGFIECSIVVIALRLAACDVPNLATEITCDVADVCAGNLTNDNFLPRHPVQSGSITYLQSEMYWESTQALGARMNPNPGYWNPESGDWNDMKSYEEVSPVIMTFNETEVGPIDENGGFQVRVFSSFPEDTQPCDPSGTLGCPLWGVGATIEQEFVIITNVFHMFSPDEGWTFIENGAHPIPQ